MKKLLVVLLTLVPTLVMADPYYNHYYRHTHSNDWFAPLVVGGIAGYIIAQPRQQTVIVQQPTYQPLPTYVPANPEPIYQYQNVYDSSCGCYRRALVQIN